MKDKVASGSFPADAEEILHQASAIIGQDAPCNNEPVVQFFAVANAEMGPDGTKSLVVSAINKAGDAGIDQRAGTHGAGLDSGVNGRARQPVITNTGRGYPECQYLGMRGRI